MALSLTHSMQRPAGPVAQFIPLLAPRAGIRTCVVVASDRNHGSGATGLPLAVVSLVNILLLRSPRESR